MKKTFFRILKIWGIRLELYKLIIDNQKSFSGIIKI